MKKLFITLTAIVAMAFCANAQVNIQEQYDFNREHLTTTLEMFKTDNWGSTFFFTDIYHPLIASMPQGYYTEIARGLNFWQNTKLGALSAHVEWNGGQLANRAWLFGAEYFLHSQDFRYTLTCEVLYKTIVDGKQDVPMQFTIVWGCNDIFGLKGLNFSGFADFWWETKEWTIPAEDPTGKSTVEKTSGVFISEPQLWYNIGNLFGCPNLFIGGEVELAYNFAGGWYPFPEKAHKNKGFTAAPAAGLKWNF